MPCLNPSVDPRGPRPDDPYGMGTSSGGASGTAYLARFRSRVAIRCTADETARFGGVRSHGGTPKLDGFCERGNSTKMDDDRGSPISGNLYLVIETCARFHFNPVRIFSVFDRLPETQRNALETPQSREARKIL